MPKKYSPILPTENFIKANPLIQKPERKKSDLNKFLELYKSFGIELKAEPRRTWQEETRKYEIELAVELRDGFGFDGHSGFYSMVHFTTQGKFIKQYFWE
jgi:hypothetical protein